MILQVSKMLSLSIFQNFGSIFRLLSLFHLLTLLYQSQLTDNHGHCLNLQDVYFELDLCSIWGYEQNLILLVSMWK